MGADESAGAAGGTDRTGGSGRAGAAAFLAGAVAFLAGAAALGGRPGGFVDFGGGCSVRGFFAFGAAEAGSSESARISMSALTTAACFE